MDVLKVGRQVVGHLLHGDLPPRDVASLFISKLLGIGILAGSCITKLPQVATVLRSRSVEGLSTISLELELYVGLIHVCYGVFFKLPITAYGEAGVIFIQNLWLILLLYIFRRESLARPACLVAVLSLVVTPVVLDQITATWMSRLYDFNSTIYLISRGPQILMVFRQGKAGQLSLLTTLLLFIGTVVRIFTSMRESSGAAMVRGFILGAAVNGLMLFQILYFGKDGRLVQPQKAHTKARAKKVQ